MTGLISWRRFISVAILYSLRARQVSHPLFDIDRSIDGGGNQQIRRFAMRPILSYIGNNLSISKSTSSLVFIVHSSVGARQLHRVPYCIRHEVTARGPRGLHSVSDRARTHAVDQPYPWRRQEWARRYHSPKTSLVVSGLRPTEMKCRNR